MCNNTYIVLDTNCCAALSFRKLRRLSDLGSMRGAYDKKSAAA